LRSNKSGSPLRKTNFSGKKSDRKRGSPQRRSGSEYSDDESMTSSKRAAQQAHIITMELQESQRVNNLKVKGASAIKGLIRSAASRK